jgi:hypothetical protein
MLMLWQAAKKNPLGELVKDTDTRLLLGELVVGTLLIISQVGYAVEGRILPIVTIILSVVLTIWVAITLLRRKISKSKT